MKNRIWLSLLLSLALLLSGCTMRTMDEMYRLPRRSETDDHLQSAIESAMEDLNYAAPIAGENQQTVQMADLSGDGTLEYIVFARDPANKSIRILVFDQTGENFQLISVIESHGSAFEQVEYADMDDRPGLEMVVGRQVSDQVLRSLSVYTFSGGTPAQLLTANYQKFLTFDLTEDGKPELVLIQPGESDADRGIVTLYSHGEDGIERTREVELSAPATAVKRIMTARLESGENAVYVASSVDESAVITDVFTLREGVLTNISASRESGTSVQTLRNYYVYADDIDGDAVLELPSLITMRPIRNSTSAEKQYLIRWYALDIQGQAHTKRHTFHSYVGGWYLELEDAWAERVSVVQAGGTYWFYVWDEKFENAELCFSVHVLSGSDREEAAEIDNRFVLHRSEGVIYAARLETGAAHYQTAKEDLIPSFHLIYQAWKTGET
jgi:hypothetical protein